ADVSSRNVSPCRLFSNCCFCSPNPLLGDPHPDGGSVSVIGNDSNLASLIFRTYVENSSIQLVLSKEEITWSQENIRLTYNYPAFPRHFIAQNFNFEYTILSVGSWLLHLYW